MAGTYAYSAYLNYSERITADEITVILNGTTYTVPKQEDEGGSWYGSIELYDDGEAECQYPFCIYHESNRNKLLVSYDVYTNHNPVSVEITQESGVTTTSCFDKARGYSCKETVTLLTEETVTTVQREGGFADGGISYSGLINAEVIKVTFNGTEYECPATRYGDDYGYGASYDDNLGAYDWSEYPFSIFSYNGGSDLTTPTAGTYSIKIEAVEEIVTTTPCFDLARGYSCKEEIVTLTEESVTTAVDPEYPDEAAFVDLAYSQLIDAETIKVTFNGTVYECEKTVDTFGNNNYGAPYDDSILNYDWSEYPFHINSDSGSISHTTLATETAGTYTVKIEAFEEIITTTPCFDKARGYSCGEGWTTLTSESVTTIADEHGYNSGSLAYSELIDAETIKVTFGGTEYECPRIIFGDSSVYGGFSPSGPDFSEYPFAILSGSDGHNDIYTQAAGTYIIKITATGMTVTTTQCFEDAVNSVIDKIECDTVPREAYVPTRINLTPPSPAVTVYANSDAQLRFSAGDRLSMYAVIRSINLPSGLVIRGYLVQDYYVTLYVRNDTDGDISVSDTDLSMQVVDFASSNRVCVMLGTNCGGPDPK